jgi:ATP-dependent HslUV protease ATP-binding subunit HslU
MSTEGMTLDFSPDALEEVANFAFRVNENTEDIGARRLHTIMERVLDEISFAASEWVADGRSHFTIDAPYVKKAVEGISKDQDLSRYIL